MQKQCVSVFVCMGNQVACPITSLTSFNETEKNGKFLFPEKLKKRD